MRIEYLYRYPVKGLSAEALEAAEVQEGDAIPWDRAFALAQGDAAFDPGQPRLAAQDRTSCAWPGQCPHRRCSSACSNPARAGWQYRAPDRQSGVSANALDPRRARADRPLPGGLPGRRGPRHARASTTFRATSSATQRLPVVSLINLASLPRSGSARRRPPPSPSLPCQCLVHRRARLERIRLDRPGTCSSAAPCCAC